MAPPCAMVTEPAVPSLASSSKPSVASWLDLVAFVHLWAYRYWKLHPGLRVVRLCLLLRFHQVRSFRSQLPLWLFWHANGAELSRQQPSASLPRSFLSRRLIHFATISAIGEETHNNFQRAAGLQAACTSMPCTFSGVASGDVVHATHGFFRLLVQLQFSTTRACHINTSKNSNTGEQCCALAR